MVSKKTIIVFVFFIVICIAVIVAVYYLYEKPAGRHDASPAMANLYIEVHNSTSLIQTGIAVFIDSSDAVYQNITSDDKSFVVVQVPLNSSVRVFNYNLAGQNFILVSIAFKK